jgi:hypothetical protein
LRQTYTLLVEVRDKASGLSFDPETGIIIAEGEDEVVWANYIKPSVSGANISKVGCAAYNNMSVTPSYQAIFQQGLGPFQSDGPDHACATRQACLSCQSSHTCAIYWQSLFGRSRFNSGAWAL